MDARIFLQVQRSQTMVEHGLSVPCGFAARQSQEMAIHPEQEHVQTCTCDMRFWWFCLPSHPGGCSPSRTGQILMLQATWRRSK